MYSLILLVTSALVAQPNLAKPTNNCLFLCDGQQQPQQWGSYVQPQQPISSYSQDPAPHGNFNYNGYNKPAYSSQYNSPDVGYVQPGNYPSFNHGSMPFSQPQVQPSPSHNGFEALFHQTASQSSQSSSSSLGYIRQFPSINIAPAVQEPIRARPAKICANQYVDPCY